MDRCPHTTRGDRDPSRCSLCLGITARRVDSREELLRNRAEEEDDRSWRGRARKRRRLEAEGAR